MPGNRYTYKFNVTGQEGTLWWHAHFSVLRATVYGALVIRPRGGAKAYPFPKPRKEATILLGEWWDGNVVDLENAADAQGLAMNISDAFTINGRPGDLYPCRKKHTYKLEVEHGETYLLRIVNAALNNQFFYKIASHSFVVVAVDASYTTPYATEVIVIAPGQTVDALLVANATPGRYYMAAHAYISTPNASFDNTTTTGILAYRSCRALLPPLLPMLPNFNDTPTAHRFYSGLTSLARPGSQAVPLVIDEHMFVTIGLALAPCGSNQPLCRGQALAAAMNNVSFRFPTTKSLLEAHFRNIPGLYTADFPDHPPLFFDFTNGGVNAVPSLLFAEKGTKAKRLRYNSTVEMVLQNTAILAIESHPMHLHGFNFFVLAQGFGNYNATEAVKLYNLVNPQTRNTIAVPTGGWAVIRFTADNPGVWIMHCHLDAHLSLGLAMVFEVEDGPTQFSKLPPPPPDFHRRGVVTEGWRWIIGDEVQRQCQ
ncbi:hypothetical protein HPP92_019416 [Vanilla planifolia]|uniref:Laccase n=1 Tax=Vanilla planifolia TaxID=51239 RepID=A0A835Q8S5_VANPL|nr:hypothetical protein HPP92_019416 [Vanilla planifolia]